MDDHQKKKTPVDNMGALSMSKFLDFKGFNDVVTLVLNYHDECMKRWLFHVKRYGK